MSEISPEHYTFHKEQPKDSNFKVGLAGGYLIVDPCYLFQGDPFWQDFCEFTFPHPPVHRAAGSQDSIDPVWITITIDGISYDMVSWSTAYGDGSYPVIASGNIIGHAGVDSGCLAIVPMELVQEYADKGLDTTDGVVVDIGSPFTPEFHDGDGNKGDGHFNDVHVITSTEVEDDDEEDDPFDGCNNELEREFLGRS